MIYFLYHMKEHAEQRIVPARVVLDAGRHRGEQRDASVPTPAADISRIRSTRTEYKPVTPARQKIDAQQVIADALAQKKSIETLREETLQELEAVNEILESIHNAPRQQRVERQRKAQIEELMAAIQERRRPAVAYQDARTQYENAVEALTRENNDYDTEIAKPQNQNWKNERSDQHWQRRDDLVEQVGFWRGQTEAQGRRLAEEQVEHDMRALDLDAYRRGLETKYRALATRENEYDDAAPELLEMAFIKQKMQLFASRMEDPKLQRRLRVERDRQTLARAAERMTHEVARKQQERKTLNWFNPLHWKKILAVDKELTRLSHALEDNRQQSMLVTTTPFEKEMEGMNGGAWGKKSDRLSEVAIRNMERRSKQQS